MWKIIPSASSFHSAAVIWQLLVKVWVFDLLKELKSRYSNICAAAWFIRAISGLSRRSHEKPNLNGSFSKCIWYLYERFTASKRACASGFTSMIRLTAMSYGRIEFSLISVLGLLAKVPIPSSTLLRSSARSKCANSCVAWTPVSVRPQPTVSIFCLRMVLSALFRSSWTLTAFFWICQPW